jgi:hypothetical protein
VKQIFRTIALTVAAGLVAGVTATALTGGQPPAGASVKPSRACTTGTAARTLCLSRAPKAECQDAFGVRHTVCWRWIGTKQTDLMLHSGLSANS